jgi:hypothetical protein
MFQDTVQDNVFCRICTRSSTSLSVLMSMSCLTHMNSIGRASGRVPVVSTVQPEPNYIFYSVFSSNSRISCIEGLTQDRGQRISCSSDKSSESYLLEHRVTRARESDTLGPGVGPGIVGSKVGRGLTLD